MLSFNFIPNASYFNETQALYIGLLDAPPQSSNSGGLTYWETQLAANPTGALNAISNYATYNGQPLNSSNIAPEIVNIYQNLLGETVTASNPGVQYWAGQSVYDGGSLSIGQITADIYNVVENIPTTSSNYGTYTEKMDNHILNYYNEAQSLYIGLFNATANESGLTYWETQLAANPTGALNAISNYATYNGQPLGSSNIASEIVNIYQNLLGETVTASNPGVQYWAGQSVYDGGSLSIGQ
ncbi:MAG: hypothetical protein ACYDDB_07445, partial [bacterium]